MWALLFLEHKSFHECFFASFIQNSRHSKNVKHFFFLNLCDYFKFVKTLNITNRNINKEETKNPKKVLEKCQFLSPSLSNISFSLSLSLLGFLFLNSQLWQELLLSTCYGMSQMRCDLPLFREVYVESY